MSGSVGGDAEEKKYVINQSIENKKLKRKIKS
jgi:hypothetical protein